MIAGIFDESEYKCCKRKIYYENLRPMGVYVSDVKNSILSSYASEKFSDIPTLMSSANLFFIGEKHNVT